MRFTNFRLRIGDLNKFHGPNYCIIGKIREVNTLININYVIDVILVVAQLCDRCLQNLSTQPDIPRTLSDFQSTNGSHKHYNCDSGTDV